MSMSQAELESTAAAVRAAMERDGVAVPDLPGLAPTNAAPAQPRAPDGTFTSPNHAPVAPQADAATPEAPVTPETPAAPETPKTAEQIAFERSQLTRRFSYLGTEEVADVAADIASGKIDEVYQRARDHERQKEKVRTLTERAETEKQAAAVEAQTRLLDLVRRQGYDVVQDPSSPDGYRVVPSSARQPNNGQPPAPGQDLEAMRARAFETRSNEDWQAYMEARDAALNAMPATIETVVEQRLAKERAEATAHAQAQQEVVQLRTAFDSEFSKLGPAFEKAGPLAEQYRELARTAAIQAANVPGATLQHAVEAARRVAQLASRGSPGTQTVVPRPAAPTVVPRGASPPAPSPLEQKPSFDTSTPDGKMKAAQWLEAQMPRVLGRAPQF